MTKAVVTGAAGFIGHHLSLRLLEDRYTVLALDREPVPVSGCLPDRVDLETPGGFEDALGDLRPDVVFHLAATAGVHAPERDLIRDNIAATLNVVRWCAAHGVQLVFASSGAIYTPAPRTSFYGLTKRWGEDMIRTSLFGGQWKICRFSNVFGYQRNTPKAIIGTWISALKSGMPVEIHGDGRQTRDFIHVDDIVEGLVSSFHQAESMEIDLCTGRQTSVHELRAMFEGILGRPIPFCMNPGARSGATTSLSEPTCGFAWKSGTFLEQGLRRTFVDHGLV